MMDLNDFRSSRKSIAKLISHGNELKLLLNISLILAPVFLLLNLAGLGGVPAGGDWSFPNKIEQQKIVVEYTLSMWAPFTALGMPQITNLPTLPFQLLILGLTSLLGSFYAFLALNGIQLATLIWGSYLFGQKYKLCWQLMPLLILGSSLFFNYLVMGWMLALFSLSILPLFLFCFTEVLSGKTKHIVPSILLMTLSVTQSQGVIWFAVSALLLAVLFSENFRQLAISLKRFGFLLLGFLFINAYWLTPLLLKTPEYITSNDIIYSDVSLAIASRYNAFTSLLGWGAVFNSQYEYVVLNEQRFVLIGNVVFALTTLVSIVVLKRSRLKLYGLALFTLPLLIILVGENRWIISTLPFGNVFRDIGRFAILGLFGSIILICALMAQLEEQKQTSHPRPTFRTLIQRAGLLSLTFALLLSILPITTDRLVSWQDTFNEDIRLRAMSKQAIVQDEEISDFLLSDDTDYKVLFLPLGGTVSFKNDPKFNGAYKEVQDIHAQLAPRPGVLFLNNRNLGGSDVLSRSISETEWTEDTFNYLGEVGFKYIVSRLNLDAPFRPYKDLDEKALGSSDVVSLVYSGKDFVIYELQSFNGSIKAVVSDGGKEYIPRYIKLSNSAYIVELESSLQDDQSGIVLNQAFDKQWHAMEITLEEFRKLEVNESHWLSPIWIYVENFWLFKKSQPQHAPIQNGSYGMLWPLTSLLPCKEDRACGDEASKFFLLEYTVQRDMFVGIVISIFSFLFLIGRLFLPKRLSNN